MGSQQPKRTRRKRKRLVGFYAYAEDQAPQRQIIERATEMANNDPKSRWLIKLWKDPEKRSYRLVDNILQQVDQCDCFLADLSGANENVLFETGYAFGRGKRLLLTIQGYSDDRQKRDLAMLDMLTSIQINRVQNANQLFSVFRQYEENHGKSRPDIEAWGLGPQRASSTGLFLKGPTEVDIALESRNEFRALFSKTIVDDWTEDASQLLRWYIDAVCQSQAVAALLVDPVWNRGQEANVRFAFVCGMAMALGRRVQMIGLPGYKTAFDYKHVLKHVDTVDSAVRVIQEGFSGVVATSPATPGYLVQQTAVTAPQTPEVDKQVVFLDVILGAIGDTLAENEEADLGDYFVPTSEYQEALRGKQTFFIGSKGSGKTANFFQLRDDVGRDVRNLVCTIKPEDYKLARLLTALRKVEDPYSRAVHIACTAWKLIIYIELVNAVFSRIRRRSIYATMSDAESELVDFVQTQEALVTAPFERRLEICADWLEQAGYNDDNFSAAVHSQFISRARKLLTPVLIGVHRAFILIDNLDKAWDKAQDLDLQARMVLALIDVRKQVEIEFGNYVDLGLVVFLRRNIFEDVLLRYSREKDKLLSQAQELSWEDESTLLKVIEKRVEVACRRNSMRPIDPWMELFPPSMDGVPIKKWICTNILPRPRDLIRFVSNAMDSAYDHGHTEIDAEDLLDALRAYSAFALNQMTAEYQAECPWISSTTSSFSGTYAMWDFRSLCRHLDRVSRTLGNLIDAREMVVRLVKSGFLGLSLSNLDTRYSRTVQDSITLEGKVRAHPKDSPLALVIHPVYRNHLGITAARPLTLSERIGRAVRSFFGTESVRTS